jgi:hypothetical protein
MGWIIFIVRWKGARERERERERERAFVKSERKSVREDSWTFKFLPSCTRSSKKKGKNFYARMLQIVEGRISQFIFTA